jgi:hypothetical protein
MVKGNNISRIMKDKMAVLVPLVFLLTSCCFSFYWPSPVNNASDVIKLDPATFGK